MVWVWRRHFGKNLKSDGQTYLENGEMRGWGTQISIGKEYFDSSKEGGGFKTGGSSSIIYLYIYLGQRSGFEIERTGYTYMYTSIFVRWTRSSSPIYHTI